MRASSILRTAALLLLAGTAACRDDPSPIARANAASPAEGTVGLIIRTADGQRRSFAVELAVDQASQEHGLMGRTSLPDNGGMLFPFPFPNMASFWMKDTPLPLDLVFIRPDGTIAAILPGKPNDLHPISAGEAVSAVLEIRQGRAEAMGLSPGDHVQWGDCKGAEPAAAWQADRFCPAMPD